MPTEPSARQIDMAPPGFSTFLNRRFDWTVGMDPNIEGEWPAIAAAREGTGLVLILSGAGLSADSGIPTFRGAEGYWTIGSRNYRPMELARREAFEQLPDDV